MPGLLILLAVGVVIAVVLATVVYVREATRPPRRTFAYAIARGLATDPAEAGLSFDEWLLEVEDGQLPVWDIALPDAVEPAGTLIFVHGWGQSRINMLALLEPFLPHAKRIIMYDLRGHGESPVNMDSRLGDAREREDLLALIQRVSDDVVIIGYSMGAMIAVEAAASDHPAAARIRQIVVHGGYSDFHRSLRGRLRLQGLPARPFTDLAMMALRLRGVRHQRAEVFCPLVSCPVTLLHGGEDAVSPIDHAHALRRLLPHATLHIFDGAHHLDMHEVAADEYERVVTDALG